jgi:DNA-binding CsgD family transcriptional regulator
VAALDTDADAAGLAKLGRQLERLERLQQAIAKRLSLIGAQLHRLDVEKAASTLPGWQSLSPRERQVLELIVEGKTNKLAGRMLAISPRTIEVHRARVMEKLNARNTADLVRKTLTAQGHRSDAAPPTDRLEKP